MVLHLDCKRDSGTEEEAPVRAARAAVLADPPLARIVGAAGGSPTATAEPAFQIDGRDLSFLRSIGIDPTRRLRRKK